MEKSKSNAILYRFPNKFEVENAKQLLELLNSRSDKEDNAEFSLALDNNNFKSVSILPSIIETLLKLFSHVSDGRGFAVFPLRSELTVQGTADILNVSKEYVIKLLENKELPCVKIGRHKQIRTSDVFRYKEKRATVRTKLLCELAELDSGLI